MSSARLTIAICIFLVTVGVYGSNPQADTTQSDLPEAAARSYAQNYKDMALAFCIEKAYASEPRANADAAATANGLDNWSRYDADSSAGEISKLVDHFLGREYHSIQGTNIRLDLLKCLDMYHSKELAAQVSRYVARPNRTYRQDNPSATQRQ